MKPLKYLIPLLFLTACTKEIPFPDIEGEAKLVVNSLYSPGNDFELTVTSTVLNNTVNRKPEKITNAIVTITNDVTGVSTVIPHVEEGLYSLEGYQPLEGTRYSVEVQAPNFETVKSIATNNAVPKAFSFDLSEHYLGFYKGTETFFATMMIDDPAQEENYYLIEIADAINTDGWDSNNDVFGHFSNDPNTHEIDNSDEFFEGQRKLYLTDTQIPNSPYSLDFWWSHPIMKALDQAEESYLECRVRSVSKAYYEYARSLELHQNAQENDFSAPVRVASNIENGFGLFAGFRDGGFVEIPLN